MRCILACAAFLLVTLTDCYYDPTEDIGSSVQTVTIASDGAGTHAAATITPTLPVVLCDCDDAQGCTITMGESGIPSGKFVIIVGETATHCDFADSAGVSELEGGVAFAMGDDDTLMLVYSVDEWVEVKRADN